MDRRQGVLRGGLILQGLRGFIIRRLLLEVERGIFLIFRIGKSNICHFRNALAN